MATDLQRTILKHFAQTIHQDSYPSESRQALIDLFQILTGENTGSLDQKDNLSLPSGMALAPHWAAACLNDTFRTRQFWRGIQEALDDLILERKRTLQVLYAGCGPFATLILPFAIDFPPEKVEFTLLEVNPESIRHLQALLERLELGSRLPRIIQVDATQWIPDREFDLIISETMQAGLRNEPQALITRHLLRHSPTSTRLIPKEISLSLGSRPLFSIDRHGLNTHEAKLTEFPDGHFRIDFPPNGEPISPVIQTQIRIWNEHRLIPNQSGLTTDLFFPLNSDSPGQTLSYQSNRSPEWAWA